MSHTWIPILPSQAMNMTQGKLFLPSLPLPSFSETWQTPSIVAASWITQKPSCTQHFSLPGIFCVSWHLTVHSPMRSSLNNPAVPFRPDSWAFFTGGNHKLEYVPDCWPLFAEVKQINSVTAHNCKIQLIQSVQTWKHLSWMDSFCLLKSYFKTISWSFVMRGNHVFYLILLFDWISEAFQDTPPCPLTYDVDGQTELGCRHDGWTYSGSSSHVSPHEVHICGRLDGDTTTMEGKDKAQ